jgi:two-component system sensor histidine kinase PilS (NtrC family)
MALDEAVQRFTQDWCQQNKSSHKTRLTLGAAECNVGFDPEHLRRVLVNLLDNALRYSGQQADSIVVTTEASTASSSASPGARLRVWSDGMPLDLTVQKHLFEPFFSSESRSSGLGLYICRELCERHGATLSYHRESATPHTTDSEGNGFHVDMKVYR